MNRTWITVLIVAVIALGVYFVWAGGGTNNNQMAEEPGNQSPAGDSESKPADRNTQWATSGHAQVSEGTVRDGCINCHTEQGFVQEGITAEEIEDPKGQTCTACHDFGGADNENKLRKIDPVTLPNKMTVDRGDSNLCVNCHNSRRDIGDPGTRSARRAPHQGPQAEMLIGVNGWEFGSDAIDYQNSAHTGFENACIVCHMAKSPAEGQPGYNQLGDHTWQIGSDNAFNRNACVDCHPQVVNGNRPAYDDYDGDGKMEGIQSEVSGLLELVKKAIEQRIDNGNGGKLSETHGSVQFLKADGTTPVEPENMDETLYLAGYNYFFVESDGSHGVHNPPYAVQLLQQSYKSITGKDVPGAAIRK